MRRVAARTSSTGSVARYRHAAVVVLPVVAIVVFALFVGGAVMSAAGAGTLGFDFLAYHRAAVRVIEGKPLYDTTVQHAGGFGLFYYPPPFVLAILPLALFDPGIAVWIWTALMLAAFLGGLALMPVSGTVRWLTLLLAGLSWPFAFAIKLGQVGPLLFLLFALGWRRLESPRSLGLAAALGAIVKLQPALLIAWAMAMKRWRAVGVAFATIAVAAVAATVVAGGFTVWLDYVAVVRNVSEPIATEHNFTPGAIAFQLGFAPGVATLVQVTASLLVVAAVLLASRSASAEASYLVAVIASQLLSPVLWDHYAMLLLLPAAWLLGRGHAWAVAIPLATSTLLIGVAPPAIYPIAFGCALVGVLVVGLRRRAANPSTSVSFAS
jgi:hypothetical protein